MAIDFMNTKQAYDTQNIFKSIYGDKGFGLPPELQRLLFSQGEANLKPQFDTLRKQSVAGLNDRGFNSAVPFSNMTSNLNSAYGRSLYDLQNSITTQSLEAGETQKANLFGALQGMNSMQFQAWLTKKMNEPGFMDVLGKLLGQGANIGAQKLGFNTLAMA